MYKNSFTVEGCQTFASYSEEQWRAWTGGEHGPEKERNKKRFKILWNGTMYYDPLRRCAFKRLYGQSYRPSECEGWESGRVFLRLPLAGSSRVHVKKNFAWKRPAVSIAHKKPNSSAN